MLRGHELEHVPVQHHLLHRVDTQCRQVRQTLARKMPILSQRPAKGERTTYAAPLRLSGGRRESQTAGTYQRGKQKVILLLDVGPCLAHTELLDGQGLPRNLLLVHSNLQQQIPRVRAEPRQQSQHRPQPPDWEAAWYARSPMARKKHRRDRTSANKVEMCFCSTKYSGDPGVNLPSCTSDM